MTETLAQNPWVEAFERQRQTGPSWLLEQRRAAIARFAEVGFPSSTDEEWRFTNIRPIVETRFASATRDVVDTERLAAYSLGEFAAAELVFVNGHFARELSSVPAMPGLQIRTLSDAEGRLGQLADVKASALVALNTAFASDGAFIQVARGAVIDRPIHLLFVSTGGVKPVASHPRVVIVAEESSQSQIVETYAGVSSGGYFSNAVTEIFALDNSAIEHCKLQQERVGAYHIAATHARLGRSARLLSLSASLGSAITRNNLSVTLAGEGAEAVLNGLTIIGDHQHVDNHTLLEHAAAHCPSHELYKHVLGGNASGVFKGKILVRPGAQKTDSKQTSRTLLLTDNASMNSQPALEIYADDVKCTHGSTTGPLDEEQVFYLRSRGVHMEAARHLLTYAFAADVTGRIRIDAVRQRLERIMAAQHGLPEDIRIAEL